jgi:hypothetical protein
MPVPSDSSTPAIFRAVRRKAGPFHSRILTGFGRARILPSLFISPRLRTGSAGASPSRGNETALGARLLHPAATSVRKSRPEPRCASSNPFQNFPSACQLVRQDGGVTAPRAGRGRPGWPMAAHQLASAYEKPRLFLLTTNRGGRKRGFPFSRAAPRDASLAFRPCQPARITLGYNVVQTSAPLRTPGAIT